MTLKEAVIKELENNNFNNIKIDYEIDGGWLVWWLDCQKEGINYYCQLGNFEELDVDLNHHIILHNDANEKVELRFNLREVN